MQLVRIFSSQDQKIFSAEKKKKIASCRNENVLFHCVHVFSFSISRRNSRSRSRTCFSSFETTLLSLKCIYVYIYIYVYIIINTNVIFYYPDLSRHETSKLTYINIEFHHNLLLLLPFTLTC